jgi:RND family efflux transporter MFP subunit
MASKDPFTVAVQPVGERPPARTWTIVGYAAAAALFAAALVWGAFAPLESAAIAGGLVSVDSNRKEVQHLEGGIVKRILVREGQQVQAGQELVLLEAGKAEAAVTTLKAKITADTTQLKLTQDELDTVEALFKKGQALRPRMLALQRKKAELEGLIAQSRAELKTAEDQIARAVIRAPIAGTVIDLKVHTAGGVVKPGEPLMSIVPRDDPLVIEAHIDPNDIDVVRPGLAAHIRLTPYNQRYAPPLEGRVVQVSADRFTDAKSGAAYYLARVQLTQKPSEIDPAIKLYPGMPAEVIIVTGQRTLLGYLAAPISRSFRRALRED